MKHEQGCLLCGVELQYSESTRELRCAVCREIALGTATCERGHYVCDRCHASTNAELIERICSTTTCTDPISLASELMASPTISMHGPEHHFLVPAVLLAAYDNLLGQPEKKAEHVAEARRRAERVPGGFCGTHGNCGAGVGAGIFWSVVSGATPLTTNTWSESNRLTAQCLMRIADHGGPRCCKRDTWHSLLQAMQFVGKQVLHTEWAGTPDLPECTHTHRNRQCQLANCVFHPAAHKLRAERAAAQATTREP